MKNNIKIAIHNERGSFSDRWIYYCQSKKHSYKIVNCYSSNIISDLADCDALMWHFHHLKAADFLMAKALLFALSLSGIVTYPDIRAFWHFDDKIGQKYLLERIGAPLVPTYVFFNKSEAISWINQATFPLVFKLRCGAGSNNVFLIRNKKEGKKIIKRAFSKGFDPINRGHYILDRISQFKERKVNIWAIIKAFLRYVYGFEYSRVKGKEKGYVYFQTFIPGNLYDVRVIVVGDKAIAIKRINREGDFRASGSGKIIYAHKEIDNRCIETAFKINENIGCLGMSYDFIFDPKGNPLVTEISYGWLKEAYDYCDGFWDKELKWHQEKIDLYGLMVENVINEIKKRNNKC